jgi:RimJ/RimL family protein N-acetyltransferase
LRAPLPPDTIVLAELMLEAFRDTIDYEGETMVEAIAEVDGWLGGVRGGPALTEVSRLAFAGPRLVSGCLVKDWQARQAPLIAYVMTHPEWKRRGAGSLVLGAVLEALRAEGHREVRAVITEGNTASERLLGRAGFKRMQEKGKQ